VPVMHSVKVMKGGVFNVLFSHVSHWKEWVDTLPAMASKEVELLVAIKTPLKMWFTNTPVLLFLSAHR